jgi:hypothetical protein
LKFSTPLGIKGTEFIQNKGFGNWNVKGEKHMSAQQLKREQCLLIEVLKVKVRSSPISGCVASFPIRVRSKKPIFPLESGNVIEN